MFALAYLCFGLLSSIGLLLLVADGVWYFRFLQASRELKRYAGGFVITTCPVCQGNLQLVEQPQSRFGIPSVTRTVICGSCESKLEELAKNIWRWRVDEAGNAEVAWLYNGEVVTDDELRGIVDGRHTPRAKTKIAEREEQRRRAARAAALADLASGKLEILSTLESRLIEAPSGVNMLHTTRLELQRNEQCMLVMSPSGFGEYSTKDNVPYIKMVDRSGEFVITNQRYGFVGSLKSLKQKLDVIERVEVKDAHTLTVSRSNRKTPEYFVGIDAQLAEAVLQGVRVAR